MSDVQYTWSSMPLLKFRNYLAASRKINMIPFGMYQFNAAADLDVIENYGGFSELAITGVQDGSNSTFVTPGPIGQLFINGTLQAPAVDYILSPGGFTCTIPPQVTDIMLAYAAST